MSSAPPPLPSGGILDITNDTITSLEEKLMQVGHAGSKEVSADNSRTAGPASEEETLGAEDMIEVHAFLERKTWIEEKIKVCAFHFRPRHWFRI